MKPRSLHQNSLLPFFFGVLLSLCLIACEPPPPQPSEVEPSWSPLIHLEDWQPAESFAPLANKGWMDCPPGSIQIEGIALEVNSTYCSFATFSSELPRDLEPGTSLRWQHWHLNLWAEEEAMGYVEFYVGDEQVHESQYIIPGPADFEEVIIPITALVEAGTSLTFHFRNHGVNSWRFGAVEFLDELP